MRSTSLTSRLGGLVLCGVLAHAAQAQPVALRGVALQDQQERPVFPASLSGRVVLLNFVYTGCSSTCPTQVRELAELHQTLPHRVRMAMQWISVTVDPANDTPAALAEYARRMGAALPGWRFATGEPAAVQGLLERMRVLEPNLGRSEPQDHRTALYLFNTRGELVQRVAGAPLDRMRLEREILQLTAAVTSPPAVVLQDPIR